MNAFKLFTTLSNFAFHLRPYKQVAPKQATCDECPAGTRCPVRAISVLKNFYCPRGTFSRFSLNTSVGRCSLTPGISR